ncbi:hypothetical protein GGX14DRAFT_403536 [Mycena pura]|uniref:Uncharacterized protein n=1 Tax=Mycena pura TaxID=153505 RepID=A0AAD6UZK3_9AGAR|nr:hypothetical protein GGX14DRAFT_403536 [Mycena pura]
MRSNAKIDAVNDRLRRLGDEYRVVRRALESLGPALREWDWMTTILPLSAARALPEVIFGDPVRQRGGKATKPKKRPKRGTGVGDGQEDGNGKQKEVSWIWVTQVDRGNPAAVNEALRIEWARTRAKAHRWSEEVDLLEEEMRRIRAFLTWHSKWWMERTAQSVWQADEVTREGKPMRLAPPHRPPPARTPCFPARARPCRPLHTSAASPTSHLRLIHTSSSAPRGTRLICG